MNEGGGSRGPRRRWGAGPPGCWPPSCPASCCWQRAAAARPRRTPRMPAGRRASCWRSVPASVRRGCRASPDPQPAGGYARSAMTPIDMNSPQFQAAERACRSLAIASGFEHPPGRAPQACRPGDRRIPAQARRAGHAASGRTGPDGLSGRRPQPGPAAIPGGPWQCAYLNP